MYQISRALYRALADDVIVEPARRPGAPTNRQLVLKACEAAIHRLATDRFYFARPERSLYREIRIYFPLAAQQRVYRTVERHLRLAGSVFASDPKILYALTGHRLKCRAWARKGRPCRRPPRVNGYCASHQHLGDDAPPPPEVAAGWRAPSSVRAR
jgi:hypothetical protein